MTETWLPVVGNSRYEVSDAGRVRSWVARGNPRHRLPTRAPAPRMLAPLMIRGRWCVLLSSGTGRTAPRRVATLVLEAHVGPAGSRYPRHADGDLRNCRLTNLRWASLGELSRAAKRRPLRGARHPRSKLTERQARIVVLAHDYGERAERMAEVLEVSVHTIYAIIAGRRWTHVSRADPSAEEARSLEQFRSQLVPT